MKLNGRIFESPLETSTMVLFLRVYLKYFHIKIRIIVYFKDLGIIFKDLFIIEPVCST